MALTAVEQLVTLNPPAAAGSAAPVLLKIFHQFQEKSLWCWVACMKMVWDSRRALLARQGVRMDIHTLCEIVNDVRDRTDCCTTEPDDCFLAIAVDDLEKGWEDLFEGFDVQKKSQLSFEEVKDEIGQRRPVQIGVGPSGDGHAVVIYGFDEVGGQHVYIHDPGVKRQDLKRYLFSEITSGRRFLGWHSSWIMLPDVER